MKLIVFSGYLRDMYPDGIKVEGASAYECVSALRLYPGFRETDGVQHTVVLPDFGSRDALTEKTDKEVIRIEPMIVGASGRGGQFLMVVVGILLIWSGYGYPAGQSVLAGAMTAGQAVSLGVMLLLNGIVGLMSPQPEPDTDEKDAKSNKLSANRNTTKIGTRVGLLFGRRKVWGHILSFNVSATTLPPPVLIPPDPGQLLVDSEDYVYDGSWGGDGTDAGTPGPGTEGGSTGEGGSGGGDGPADGGGGTPGPGDGAEGSSDGNF